MSGAGFEIVRLTPEDWQAHRALRLEALATNPEAFGATYADNAAYDEATWRARMEAVTYWQGLRDGEALGMVGLWDPLTNPDELDEAEVTPFLISMFVRPAARGQGLGAALVQAVIAEARARGHRQLVLDVREANEPAKALYRAHGFVQTDDRVPDPGEGGCEVAMVLDLAG